MQIGIDQCPVGQPMDGAMPSLVEQAEGLSRREAMKRVVGPAFDRFLRPIYDEPISPGEAAHLPDTLWDSHIRWGENGKQLMSGAMVGLRRRLRSQMEHSPHEYEAIKQLVQARPDLFVDYRADVILEDGIETDVVTPLIVATHIHRIEVGRPGEPRKMFTDPFDYENVVEIMRRDSMDRILTRLAKGPFGFLGIGGVGLSWGSTDVSDAFFEFKRQTNSQGESMLTIAEAYKVKNGRVVDLSGAYHIAAEAKRQELETYESTHGATDSDGCPMKRRFRDEAGELQDSLIVTGQKFLVNALRVSARKSAAHEAANRLKDALGELAYARETMGRLELRA